MVCIAELPQKHKLHVMESDRYSIWDTQVHDDVSGRFVTVDDIVENITTQGLLDVRTYNDEINKATER